MPVLRFLLAPVAAAIILLTGLPALADCVYNGQTYPDGTRVGAFVCKDGQWVEG